MLKAELSNIDLKKDFISEDKSLYGRFISGFQLLLVRTGMRIRLFRLIGKSYSDPKDWFKAIKYLITLRKNILGVPSIKKLAKVNGQYYMGIYAPAWFSKEFDQFIYSQLNDFKPLMRNVKRFEMVFISVTNKCPYQCEHCYHWNLLNKNDQQSLEDLIAIIHKLQQKGVSHIQFTGGEPLLEYKKICEAVKSSKLTSEFWITTSGFSLSEEKAKELKSSGIRGVIISLDHYDADKHNKFRNHKDAFNWANFAVKNAIGAELIAALSICVTKEFLTLSNLENYMKLAKDLGVMFVQFLEPKQVGHYEKKDILLTENQILQLEQFFLKYNFKPRYKEYPIIIYPGYYQRKKGCRFSGKKSIYIDTNGTINPCPFCHKSYGKVLEDDFNTRLENLVNQGCVEYQ